MDESLVGMTPVQLKDYNSLKAVVLKPTRLGLERSMQLARIAVSRGITPVISSTFESSVGLTVLAQFAAAVVSRTTAVGLDTQRWLAADLIGGKVVRDNGTVEVASLPRLPDQIDWSKLHRV